MTAALMPAGGAIAPMSDCDIEKVRGLEKHLLNFPQVEIPTEHVIHAGLYARTIRIPAGVAATGVLIKTATVLIISGDCTLYVGGGNRRLQGYHVVPAGAGRKQACLAHADTFVTMLFPTDATTVADAEEQFTDETDFLQSRQRDGLNTIHITGEASCPALP
jgi:hypothetical protein